MVYDLVNINEMNRGQRTVRSHGCSNDNERSACSEYAKVLHFKLRAALCERSFNLQSHVSSKFSLFYDNKFGLQRILSLVSYGMIPDSFS